MPQKLRALRHFHTLAFHKTPEQIREAARGRIAEVKKKIAEREERIKEMCEEVGLNVVELLANLHEFDADLLNNSFMREGELPPIKAGVKASMLEESKQIQAAKEVLEELQTVVAHLSDCAILEHEGQFYERPVKYALTFDELRYFGFTG